MNVNYYDLYYTVIKSRKEIDDVEKQDIKMLMKMI